MLKNHLIPVPWSTHKGMYVMDICFRFVLWISELEQEKEIHCHKLKMFILPLD